MIREILEIIKLVFVTAMCFVWLYISMNIAIESKRTDGKPFIVFNTYEAVPHESK